MMAGDGESYYDVPNGTSQKEAWETDLAGFLTGVDPSRPYLSGSAASSILQPAYHSYIDKVEDDLSDVGQLGVVLHSMMEAFAEHMITADTEASSSIEGGR